MTGLPLPRPARVAIVGIGNEVNGDDGAGVQAVRRLAARRPAVPGALLLDTGTAPESFTGPLRRFRPDLVITIDAAAFGEPAGTARWLDWRHADGLSASTHTLPPSVLATFLEADLGCRVALIGIQPARFDMGAGLSPQVDAGVQRLVDLLDRWLRG